MPRNDIEFIQAPDTWPLVSLPLVRWHKNGEPPELGTLRITKKGGYLVSTEDAFTQYPDAVAVVRDGWLVD